MKSTATIAALCLAAAGSLIASETPVKVVDCPKCPMRMRFAADGKSATINKSRLMDDRPDAAELDRRLAAMTARAEKLLVKDDPNKGALTRPLMGWSSWNTFRVNISPDIILGVARVMATNGLKTAGYTYINTDDGFFGGRDKDGKLLFHKERFPNGLKGMVDEIHALGFKAGIYSEAGKNTCGSIFDNDKAGVGSGLSGHDAEDCRLFFKEIGFDFIKVDFCTGPRGKEKERYTEIANAIKATGRTDVRFNICRWAFPGTWAADIAGSWRTTGDICAKWDSLQYVIRKNLYLNSYASPGHYNDMDMMIVGRLKGEGFHSVHPGEVGLTLEEERLHFGLWCMMSSPLLIGCDPRTMPQSSFDLLTNPYLLAMNQNDLGLHPYVASCEGTNTYVLVKDAVASGAQSAAQCCVYIDGKLVVDAWAGTYATNSTRKIDGSSLFPIFSTEKQMLVAAVHRAVEKGKLSFDTKIGDVWHEFACKGKENITLENVITHRTGLPGGPLRGTTDEQVCDWDFMVKQCADFTASKTVPPGTRSQYLGITYAWLLGEPLSRALKMPLRDALIDLVLKPAGIDNDFYFGITDKEEPRCVTVYNGVENYGFEDMNKDCYRKACIPSAYAMANARAIAKFYVRLGGLDGKPPLLTDETMANALKPRRWEGEPVPDAETLRKNWQTVWGLGFGLWGDRDELDRIIGAGGLGGSEGFLDRKNRIAIGYTCAVSATACGKPYDLRPAIYRAVGIKTRYTTARSR